MVNATQFTCSAVGNALINKVSAISGPDVWAFFNQPFILAIAIALAGEITGGISSAIASNRLQASGFSCRGTDEDTLSYILACFPAGRAGQATITVNTITGTFSFGAVPTNQRGIGITCGAPATDPTTGIAS